MTDSPPSRAVGLAYLFLCFAVVATAVPKFTTVWFLGLPIQLSDVMILAGTLALCVHVIGEKRIVASELYLPMVVYFGAALLSLINADNLPRSMGKIVGIGSLMATLVLGLHVVDSRKKWNQLADVWIAAGLATAAVTLVGVFAYFAGFRGPMNVVIGNLGSLPPGAMVRMEGTFLNSNLYCNYLGVTGCLLLARRHDLVARYGNVAYFAALATLAMTLPFTMSPNLGAVALSLIIFLAAANVFSRRLRWSTIVACSAAVVFFAVITVLMIVPKGQGDVGLGPVGDLKMIASGRVAGWRATLDVVADHPIVGTGVGERVAHFRHEYAAQGSSSKPTEFHLEAHNVYLGLLAQMGPLALLGFVWLVWRLLRKVRSMGREPAEGAWVRACLLAAIVGQTLYGGIYGGFEDSRHTWLLFALAATAPLSSRQNLVPSRRNC